MSTVTTMPPQDWTVDDLDGLPEDGLRYELVDGVLLVSAAPSYVHQLALTNLVALMVTTCPRPRQTLVARSTSGSARPVSSSPT